MPKLFDLLKIHATKIGERLFTERADIPIRKPPVPKLQQCPPLNWGHLVQQACQVRLGFFL
ncbi:MAG: hypothetical protein CM15mP120_10000 [Pseudomonadota bacterium]|nr:MAG: hypothetical protein CM15mP120_10000 [Pseudomonadota bacterium]